MIDTQPEASAQHAWPQHTPHLGRAEFTYRYALVWPFCHRFSASLSSRRSGLQVARSAIKSR